jgi:hypothetical protein
MATNICIKVKIQATTFMRAEWMEFHNITSKEKKNKFNSINPFGELNPIQ